MTVKTAAASAAVIALLAAGSPAALGEAPKHTALPIVDQAISHHGGEAYTSSRTRLTLCSKAGCSRLDVATDGGLYKYRVRGEVRGVQRTVLSTNDGVEWWIEEESQPVDPEREQSLRDWAMARVYFCFLPFRLNDPGVFKQDQGLETWGDRRLRRVKVTFSAGSSTDADDQYLHWFDPESGRLEQFAYSFGGDPGGLRFRRLHNYRRVGGILFFDQENLGVEGPGLQVDQIDPGFVAARMSKVSDVRLKDIEVLPAEM